MKTLNGPSAAPVWQVQRDGERPALAVSGDWIAQSGPLPDFPVNGFAKIVAPQTVAFTMTGVGRWDSGLIAFLWDAKRIARTGDIVIDDSALPQAARKLLGLLADARPANLPEKPHRHSLLKWTGNAALAILTDLGTVSILILLGATVRAAALAPFGRTKVRAIDVLADLRGAGPSALLIVSVVNFLIGAILAFVGAAQLRKFAA